MKTLAVLLLCAVSTAFAQQKPPAADPTASMVKPPAAAGASTVRPDDPNNPDNMPMKRPTPPPNSDRMIHSNPASDAIAK
jgi:hypothetical protein